MKKFNIDCGARQAVYERSEGICERCGELPAVHVHHLTYERAGHEESGDLQHICIRCHMQEHPGKAESILRWEINRRARITGTIGLAELETDEEHWSLEGHEKIEVKESSYNEHAPALNLGNYRASAYCIEDVEREEMERNQ